MSTLKRHTHLVRLSLILICVLLSFPAYASHALEAVGSVIIFLFWTVIIFSVVSLSTSILRLFYINKVLGVVSFLCGILLLIATTWDSRMLTENPILILPSSLLWMLIIHKKRETDTYRNSLKFRALFTIILLISVSTLISYFLFLIEMAYDQFIISNLISYFLTQSACFFHFRRKDQRRGFSQSKNYWVKLILIIMGIFGLYTILFSFLLSLQFNGHDFLSGLIHPLIGSRILVSLVSVGISGVLAVFTVLALRPMRKLS